MKTISDAVYGGERPLFGERDLELENVKIEPGESALKCCRNIVARNCEFQGKYPFWHVDTYLIEGCKFTEGARAALWYGRNCTMKNCTVDAPKMFREIDGLTIEHTDFPDAEETMWHCRNVRLRDVKVSSADYLFMHSENIDIDRYEQHGNYSFQYCRNVTIADADIDSKDAFWETDNVTVRDSRLKGEYLGWHSRNLRLINCHISGTQPLCYAEGLVLENCTFDPDADLAFEESIVDAVVNSRITSVKNPTSGRISALGYGEIIIDKNIKAPADCLIETHE